MELICKLRVFNCASPSEQSAVKWSVRRLIDMYESTLSKGGDLRGLINNKTKRHNYLEENNNFLLKGLVESF